MARKVFRGIQALHPAREKQARPMPVEQLEQVAQWPDRAISAATACGERASCLRHGRDKAVLLLGFWRGFRGGELTRLRIEHVDVAPGQAVRCFLAQTKGDRQFLF